MPPGHHSSSSHSSRSHSSSSRSHSSSSHSSSSHSHSFSHSRSSHSSSYSGGAYRSVYGGYNDSGIYTRSHISRNTPAHILQNCLHISCKNHRYIYYPETWIDNSIGKTYQKGYYDENGRHYAADEIIFKTKDGTCKTSFKCEYCGTEAEYNWTDGSYPHCSNCGALMTRMPTYIDEVVEIKKVTDYTDYAPRRSGSSIGKNICIFVFACMVLQIVGAMISLFISQVESDKEEARKQDMLNSYQFPYTNSYNYGHVNMYTGNNSYANNNSSHDVSNIEIYGSTIYLDEIADNTYVLCDREDEYEKKLTWDYGADSYYDSASDCYIWYNTDVSPNLWQYWYDDIAGNNVYGWMEYEEDGWFIETRQNYWQKYGGDISKLWHIEVE